MTLICDPFLVQKPPNLSETNSSLRSFLVSSSQNIGGTDAWAVPTSICFGGTVPTVTPKSPPMYVCLSLSSLPKFPNHQFPTMTLDNNCARLHIGVYESFSATYEHQ